MKLLNIKFCIAGLFLLSSSVYGQRQLESPRDSVSGEAAGSHISINYGSPAVKGRKIWGALVPFGQVWRAGANEATRFVTSKDILVEGKKLQAGEYALFAIPGDKNWIVIFNRNARQWGAFEYNEREDALRVPVEPVLAGEMAERLRYEVSKNQFLLCWENLAVPVKMESVSDGAVQEGSR